MTAYTLDQTPPAPSGNDAAAASQPDSPPADMTNV
jgi:hypothetical protein